jgi:hypothetical protein
MKFANDNNVTEKMVIELKTQNRESLEADIIGATRFIINIIKKSPSLGALQSLNTLQAISESMGDIELNDELKLASKNILLKLS